MVPGDGVWGYGCAQSVDGRRSSTQDRAGKRAASLCHCPPLPPCSNGNNYRVEMVGAGSGAGRGASRAGRTAGVETPGSYRRPWEVMARRQGARACRVREGCLRSWLAGAIMVAEETPWDVAASGVATRPVQPAAFFPSAASPLLGSA
jgi:hypothetical protein